MSQEKRKKGNIYFGSLNGVTAFHPKDLIANYTTTPLTLVSVKKYNNKSQRDTIITNKVQQEKQLTILPSDREIKLHFVLLDYNNPKQTQYAYKIEELDKDWTYLKNPEMNLAGLPYGQYSLLLKEKGIEKKREETPLKIEIVVLWPFYFSWWFIGISIRSLTLLISLIINLRLRILEQQKNKLTELVNLKTATIQEQTEELKSLDKMKTRFL